VSSEKDLRGYQAIQGQGLDHSIGINHKQILIEGWVDTDNVLDLVVNLKFQRIHRRAEVNLGSTMNASKHPLEESTDLVQEVHESHLGITLASVTRSLPLGGLANFDQHDIWDDMTGTLV